jgi:hypothetical protein
MRTATLAITLILGATIAAQSPSHLNFDPARAPIIDRALQRYVDSDKVAGIVALVMQDGKVVYEKAFGWADKEAGRKMTTDTIFRIASQTKRSRAPRDAVDRRGIARAQHARGHGDSGLRSHERRGSERARRRQPGAGAPSDHDP